jgi:hypothetical protein
LKRGTPVLPGVWALKRKRRILSGDVYKHKARWNLDRSKQVFGREYDETYSPVVQWPVIRLMLIESLKHNYITKAIGFCSGIPAGTHFQETVCGASQEEMRNVSAPPCGKPLTWFRTP